MKHNRDREKQDARVRSVSLTSYGLRNNNIACATGAETVPKIVHDSVRTTLAHTKLALGKQSLPKSNDLDLHLLAIVASKRSYIQNVEEKERENKTLRYVRCRTSNTKSNTR